jgi:hypothetical protein
VSNAFGWFNRPRLNQNVWQDFTLIARVHAQACHAKHQVQSARLNQLRDFAFIARVIVGWASPTVGVSNAFGWFNRPRLNQNVWQDFTFIAWVHAQACHAKRLVQSARLNQLRDFAFIARVIVGWASPTVGVSNAFGWFNRPRLNQNVWHDFLSLHGFMPRCAMRNVWFSLQD